jgi:hypothetical protein
LIWPPFIVRSIGFVSAESTEREGGRLAEGRSTRFEADPLATFRTRGKTRPQRQIKATFHADGLSTERHLEELRRPVVAVIGVRMVAFEFATG